MDAKTAIALGNGDFEISTVSLAAPQSDEVLIKIHAAGLCHTDYDSLSWGKPIVMGHEGAGEVAAMGNAVEDLAIGDAVILNWATPCYTCGQCSDGNQHLCMQNSPVIAGANGYTPGHAHLEGTLWKGAPIERSFNLGTLSEYCLVKRSAVVKVADKPIDFAAAAIISCGVMTGYGSVMHAAKVTAGSSVVVLGCGGVGLSVIQACRIAGARDVIAVDINARKLEWAMQFGATETLLADRDDKVLIKAADQVKKMLDGTGADFAFECTAVPALGAAPLAMIRNAGTAVQVSGIEEEITIDMRLFEWDKIYINPLYGQAQPQRDFPVLWKLHEEGQLQLRSMITGHYALEDLPQAFSDLLEGKNAKSVVVF